MPAPYTIEQTAEASGLSIKFIRRLKAALPEYFGKHTERGQSNALLFDEEILETLKRTRDLKDRGRTLQQIRDDLAMVAARHQEEARKEEGTEEAQGASGTEEGIPAASPSSESGTGRLVGESLQRENALLRTQVTFLQELLRRTEARFDRLLPGPSAVAEPVKKQGLKSQLLLWLVEAAVVTVFAAGFIFLIWLFAQKAFTL